MSFWKKMLGIGPRENEESAEPKMLAEDEYKGFEIRAMEMKSGSEYQLCGEIEKTVDGEVRMKQFIRADKLSSAEEVAKFSLKKARQIIDERGDDVFDSWI
ncbi:MAG: HlyU family transcriptional regulator [Devosiaceae bacterium]|nr:HlyU family transcriptional regulator [Devosiaceae bacterium]